MSTAALKVNKMLQASAQTLKEPMTAQKNKSILKNKTSSSQKFPKEGLGSAPA